LPGGALLTVTAAAQTWSLPNIHGDVTATTNAAGVKQGATFVYDAYGNATGGLPDNSSGNLDYGWLGKHQRPLEHQPGLTPMIEMGARQYHPGLGRFIEVDPVEGGNANDYSYVDDPINGFDLDGRCGRFGNPFRKCKPKNDPSKWGPKFFCGNVSCIAYQTNPNTGHVQWGFKNLRGFGTAWTVSVYVNGKRVDYKSLYMKGTPHGSINPKFAPPGSKVTIKASAWWTCTWGMCLARSVANSYVVPRRASAN
jgi:RHS repeat-associated protein